jgi:hypothetical protein
MQRGDTGIEHEMLLPFWMSSYATVVTLEVIMMVVGAEGWQKVLTGLHEPRSGAT